MDNKRYKLYFHLQAKLYCAIITLLVSATVLLNTLELFDDWQSTRSDQQKLIDEAVTSVLFTSNQIGISAAVALTNATANSIDDEPIIIGGNTAATAATVKTFKILGISFYQILITIMYFLEHNFVQLLYCFGDWLMIIISLVLREAVDRFQQIVEDSNSTGVQVLFYRLSKIL